MNIVTAERTATTIADIRALCDRIDALRLTEYRDREEAERLAARIADHAATVAGGQYRPPYNGWKNRETWNAMLWIGNEPGPYNTARAIVAANLAEPTDYPDWTPDEQRSLARAHAAEALKEWWIEEFGPTEEGERAGPASDAWTYAAAWIEWRDIVDALTEE